MKQLRKQLLLQRIVNHLTINGDLDDLGLFHGKIGIVIFFFHYARYANNPIYEEFAEGLLDGIIEKIHDWLPIDFENGYLGIGWGIEYLARQKFIDENTNDILEEIDEKIMERDVRRISDLSLNTGLEGVLHYVLARLHNNKETKSLFDKHYLSDLLAVANNLQSNSVSESLATLGYEYKNWYNSKKLNYDPLIYLKKICWSKNEMPDNDKVHEWELGLHKGCAGLGVSKFIDNNKKKSRKTRLLINPMFN